MENSSTKIVTQKDITDDIWFEIFLRLPLDSIYKFRCVSKIWFSILSSPNFINNWYKLNYASLPWGLVHKVYVSDDPMTSTLRFSYPELHSRFISDHPHGFSFRFLLDQVEDEIIYLLGTSNGLVLCTTTIYDQKTYYVCNPLTQKWVLLPPPPTEIQYLLTALMCDECNSESTSYKVIRIPKVKAVSMEFKVEIFSSDLGEWKTYHVSCPPDVTWKSYYSDYFVTLNGILYWFQKLNNRILAVSVNSNTNEETCGNECKLINMPDGNVFYSRQCLGESEGLLCFSNLEENKKSLSVWVLDGDRWYTLHKDIKLHGWLAEIESQLVDELEGEDLITEIAFIGFSPVDKNVVILGYDEYVWSYNTKTLVYQQLCHHSFPCSDASASPRGMLNFLKPRPTRLPPISSERHIDLDVQTSNMR